VTNFVVDLVQLNLVCMFNCKGVIF